MTPTTEQRERVARMGILERFWRWLYEYADKQAAKHYMNRAYHDRRCPNCGTWLHTMNGAKSSRLDEARPDYDYMTCANCGHESEWFLAGGFAFSQKSTTH